MRGQAKTEKRWGRGLSLLAGLLLATAALGLGACGGGEGSTSSSAPPPSPGRPATTTSTAPREEPRAAKPTAKASHPPSLAQTESSPAAARHSAGKAAPFLVPQGDNSIPTFGSESTDSDRGRAEAALRAYLTARAKGDWQAACAGLAATTRQGIERLGGASKKGCAALYAALSSRIPAAARAIPLTGALVSLRVKGRSGFALFYGPRGKAEKYVMPMAREGGAWRVTQLAPIRYPLGAPTPTSP
jgi:hypothetical protein